MKVSKLRIEYAGYIPPTEEYEDYVQHFSEQIELAIVLECKIKMFDSNNSLEKLLDDG